MSGPALGEIVARLDAGAMWDESAGIARDIVRVLGGDLSAGRRDAYAAEWRAAIRGDLGATAGLVPDDWAWVMDVLPGVPARSYVTADRHPDAVSGIVGEGSAPTPARALLLALLRAHAAAAAGHAEGAGDAPVIVAPLLAAVPGGRPSQAVPQVAPQAPGEGA